MASQNTDTNADIPAYISEGLEKQSPAALRRISELAEEIADRKVADAKARLEEEAVDESDLPDDVLEHEPIDAPGGAGVTTKTIDGNDYYYYQWREGETIKSEYIRPLERKIAPRK